MGYLDLSGLQHYDEKIKDYIDTTLEPYDTCLDFVFADNWDQTGGRDCARTGGAGTSALRYGVRPKASEWQAGETWTIEDSRNVTASTSTCNAWLPCSAGDIVHVYGYGGALYRILMFQDNEGRQLIGTWTIPNFNCIGQSGEIIVPAPYGTAYVVANARNAYPHYLYVQKKRYDKTKNITDVENFNTVSVRDVAEGDLFIGNGNMFKATSPISINGNIVPETLYGASDPVNCVATNILSEMNATNTNVKNAQTSIANVDQKMTDHILASSARQLWNPEITVGKSINATTGLEANSQNARARTNIFFGSSHARMAIEMANPAYEISLVFYYEDGRLSGSSATNNYTGICTDFATGIALIPAYAKEFAVRMRRTDGANWTSSDTAAVYASLYRYCAADDTLTMSGFAADAKAAGDRLEALLGCIADKYDESGSTSYTAGKLAIYNYSLYKCVSPTSGAWDSTKWTQTTLAAEFA